MKNPLAKQVHRIVVSDPIASVGRHDYADAFEVHLPEPDLDAPQAWLIPGLDDLPAAALWITSLLGMRSEASTSADRIDGWRVVESNSEVVHLERSVPLLHVVLVGRRTGPMTRVLTTILTYRRPLLGRLAWALVGPLHRRFAPRVITSKRTAATELPSVWSASHGT